MKDTILAYRRKEGFGVRNYVLVISLVDCANVVAEKIARLTDTIPILHERGCCESEPDHEYTVNALVHAGKGPNVHSVLLVGLGCEQTDGMALKEAIEEDGKRVELIMIQDAGGPPDAVQLGAKIVDELKRDAQAQEREEFSVKDLVVAVQCGGSDWTTALTGNASIGETADIIVSNGGSVVMSEIGGIVGSEHIVAENSKSYEVGLQILDMVERRREAFLKKYGHPIEKINPTPGNKKGGITTLVEKSSGNIKKIGTTPVQGVLGLYDKVPHSGVWLLDHKCVGPDQVNTSAYALSGAHITIFSTGRGNPIGNAIMPLVKITGNPDSYRQLESMFDFNAGLALEGEDLKTTGSRLYNIVLEVASGRTTKNEENGNFEFHLLYPSLG